MSGKIHSFHAKDAITYVDTYRRLRLEEPAFIEREKNRLEEKFWNVGEATPRYFAELRAHEHALEYALKRKEPDLVVLGDVAAGVDPADDAGVQSALHKALQQKDEQIAKLTGDVASLTDQIAKLSEANKEVRVEVSNKQQQIRRLRERLYQANSTFMSVGAVLIVVILVLLSLYFSRG